MKDIWVYPYSRNSAERDHELGLWQSSNEANIACAQAIEKEIAKSLENPVLEQGAASRIIDSFGFERVNWVLSTTIQQIKPSELIDPEHRKWACRTNTDNIRDEILAYKINRDPAALNSFVDKTRETWQKLGLFEYGHCMENSDDMDFTGKVVVLDPANLKDEYKHPDQQLIRCTGGFGASPAARGRKVYGSFMVDGEDYRCDRGNILGVLKDEHLPAWAREKYIPERLKELTAMLESRCAGSLSFSGDIGKGAFIEPLGTSVTGIMVNMGFERNQDQYRLRFQGLLPQQHYFSSALNMKGHAAEVEHVAALVSDLEKNSITVTEQEARQWGTWLLSRQMEQAIESASQRNPQLDPTLAEM